MLLPLPLLLLSLLLFGIVVKKLALRLVWRSLDGEAETSQLETRSGFLVEVVIAADEVEETRISRNSKEEGEEEDEDALERVLSMVIRAGLLRQVYAVNLILNNQRRKTSLISALTQQRVCTTLHDITARQDAPSLDRQREETGGESEDE